LAHLPRQRMFAPARPDQKNVHTRPLVTGMDVARPVASRNPRIPVMVGHGPRPVEHPRSSLRQ
jgi:hypothetical protein